MVVVKQSVVLKTLTQFPFSMLLILIADVSPITPTETGNGNSSPNMIKTNDGISKSISKTTNNIHLPILSPGSLPSKNSVQETPVVKKMDDFLSLDNKTFFTKAISETEIKQKIGDVDGKLPFTKTVILNDSAYANEYTNNSTPELTAASELQAKSLKLYNQEASKKTTIIFLVSVALVSASFYLILVSLRKILERKYGDKQLLVQHDSKQEDYLP